MTADEAKQAVERMMAEALLNRQDDSVHNLFNGIIHRARQEQVPFDGAALLEYFWHLARIGAVAVPGDAIQALSGKVPRLHLTDRGQKLLSAAEHAPHNPSKYLNAARNRVSQPDEIVLSYLVEAIEAWRSGLNRSSAVMLGCACERLVIMLAERIAGSSLQPFAERIKKRLQSHAFVSALFNEILNALMELRKQNKIPRELDDALERKVTAIFEYARGLRNQSGHPTGAEVSAEDAEAGLLLFPGFWDVMAKLIKLMETI